ncbi:SDR family NAD(P)-dependent oxidoreductase [Streptomyces erythrochromogenes]|uniref:SDR family NAD(P)-dependent oxidoreductase n=1 Tax=Streptomyces erythrochromogenes TaxID=285574 RepID=UPI0036A98F27
MKSVMRSVLVTGSTSGIGEAIAMAFAAEGHTVIVNGRDPARTESAAVRISSSGGNVVPAVGDVSEDEGIREILQAVPKVDILVNNAGIFSEKPAFDISDEEWRHHFEVNVLSGVRLTRHYLPGMIERGWGRVMFISSDAAIFPTKEMIHYSMTKTAQLAVSRGFAVWAAGSGVTVNSILPGPTRTPGAEAFIARAYPGLTFEEAERRFFDEYRPTSLLKRFSSPGEIANLVHYIGSDAASATTGAVLRADGGLIPTLIP